MKKNQNKKQNKQVSYWLLIPFIFFFIYNTVNKKKPLIKKEDWNGG
jgi:RsiW-degrading membrane proteinase PrsW (M82 family)